MRLIAFVLASLFVSGCSTSDREAYVDEMSAACRRLSEQIATIGPAVDPQTMEIDHDRVERTNALQRGASDQFFHAVKAVEPPKALAREHAALLAAISKARAASADLGEATESAAAAYRRGTEPEDPSAVGRTFDAWRDASTDADRAAQRLDLDACRAS